MHTFNTSQLVSFQNNFTFPLNGTTYTRVAVNRYSGSIIFIPENGTYDVFYREISTPTYASFVDDDVPLRWMKVSPSTGDKVRIVCVWCDQYDWTVGNITWQQSNSAPGSRIFRINLVALRHTFLFPVGTMTAQVTLYESTGAIKVQYIERSIVQIGLGAVGMQLTTDDALNVPNKYLEYQSSEGCPVDAAIVYTPGTFVDRCDALPCTSFMLLLDCHCFTVVLMGMSGCRCAFVWSSCRRSLSIHQLCAVRHMPCGTVHVLS